MSKRLKKLIKFLVTVQMALLVLLASAVPALADGTESIKKIYKGTVVVSLYPKREGGHAFRLYSASGKVKINKNSNKKVLKATVEEYHGVYTLIIEGKKAGSSTLTYTYKGKKHTIKFTFKKWQNPIGKITIGGKNYTKDFKNAAGIAWSDMYSDAGDGLGGKKLKVTAAKGWKLKSIKYLANNGFKSMKNGAKVPKNYGTVFMEFKNKKTGAIVSVWMY